MPENQTEANEHRGPSDDRPKTTTIVVNGRAKKVHTKELTFDQVVALAFDPLPTGENVVFTISWKAGGHREFRVRAYALWGDVKNRFERIRGSGEAELRRY